MLGGKEVYRSIELNDNIKTSSLGIMDQIRLIFSKVSNDDTTELDTNEKLTKDKLQHLAALNNLIEKVTKQELFVKKGSATLHVSSEFIPYIDEVINEVNGWGRFYDIRVYKQSKMAGVKYYFVVQIRKKGEVRL